MGQVIAQEDLSTEIVQNQFRDPLQTAADDGSDPLKDPRSGKRDSTDDSIPPFVLPSFPDQNPLYPHIIVSEAGYSASNPDARATIKEGGYEVETKILARSTTQVNKIADGVRHWFHDQYDTLISNGFNDPEIAGGGDVPNYERDVSVETKIIRFSGTVYTN
jgi:hypothetical protein